MIKFPQPTVDELAEEKHLTVFVNRFWWEILQGQIEDITDPALWPDYNPDIAQAIHEMMVSTNMPVAELVAGKVYLSADQSINSATGTKVLLDSTEKLENMTFANNELTVVESGYYSIKAQIGYSTGGGYRGGEIRVNNATEARFAYGNSGIAQVAISNYVNLHWEGDLSAGDDISLLGIHQSSGSINMLAGDNRTWLAVHRIG